MAANKQERERLKFPEADQQRENDYQNRKGPEAKKGKKKRKSREMEKVKRNSTNSKHLQKFWATVWKNCYVRL